MTDLPTYDHLSNADLIRLYQYHDSALVRVLLERIEIAMRDLEDAE
jgi:hypothetical protein